MRRFFGFGFFTVASHVKRRPPAALIERAFGGIADIYWLPADQALPLVQDKHVLLGRLRFAAVVTDEFVVADQRTIAPAPGSFHCRVVVRRENHIDRPALPQFRGHDLLMAAGDRRDRADEALPAASPHRMPMREEDRPAKHIEITVGAFAAEPGYPWI